MLQVKRECILEKAYQSCLEVVEWQNILKNCKEAYKIVHLKNRGITAVKKIVAAHILQH